MQAGFDCSAGLRF